MANPPAKVRPLGRDERAAMYQDLAALAIDLVATNANDVQRLLGDALAYGYPSTGSGSGTEPANQVDADGVPVQPDSMTERLALRPDRMAVEAHHLVTMLRRTHRLVVSCRDQLQAWDPARAVRHCTRCGHPLGPDETRCQQRDEEGRQCGARETAARSCRICGEVQEPGQPLRQGRCNACRMFHARHGHDRNTATRLALGDNLEVADDE